MLSIFDTGSVFERRSSVKDSMDCVFSPEDLDRLPQESSLVTKGGLSTINAHEITVITGTEAARTALFAKMLAATIIRGGEYPFADGMTTQLINGRVLWVDAVNSFEAVVQLTRDLKNHFNASHGNFRAIALTAIGFDQNYSGIVKQILNETILDFEPNLIIINDLDNLFPNATWNFSKNFVEYLRDYVAMNNAAVCAIGHNLIGKVKKTSGYAGEIMYPVASTVYRVSERSKKNGDITRVSCYKTFTKCPDDFLFVINEHNFPQQVGADVNPCKKTVSPLDDNKITNEYNNILTFPPKKIFKKKIRLRHTKSPARQLQLFRETKGKDLLLFNAQVKLGPKPHL